MERWRGKRECKSERKKVISVRVKQVILKERREILVLKLYFVQVSLFL